MRAVTVIGIGCDDHGDQVAGLDAKADGRPVGGDRHDHQPVERVGAGHELGDGVARCQEGAHAVGRLVHHVGERPER